MTDLPPFVVAIPARYASSRLPGKPLAMIAGDPMVLHVARRALAAGAQQVIVATDDARIVDALRGEAVQTVLTRVDHASGSDRLAECVELLGWAQDCIVVNLQGDEPLAPVSGIRAVVRALAESAAPMATLATRVANVEEWLSPHCVKVVCSLAGDALYFSRAPVPWPRDAMASQGEGRQKKLPDEPVFLRHVGIYAYRAGFLRTFSALAPTAHEETEALEQLRALEHGYRIAVRLAPDAFPAGVDTPEDLLRVQAVLAASA